MSAYPLLLHLVACLWYIFFWNTFLTNSRNDDNYHPDFRAIQELGTRYLTNWNVFIQTLFFAGCLFHDVMKMLNGPNWLKLGSKFQTLLSLSFSSILLPLGLYVSVTFWMMFAYDREIVYPKLIDSYIPSWQNHGMHTTIVPLLLAEMFTTRHRFPLVKTSLMIFSTFTVCYAIVFLATFVEKGRWVYPLFGMLSLPISIAVMLVFLLILISFVFIGIFLQNMYWGKEEKKRYRKYVKKST